MTSYVVEAEGALDVLVLRKLLSPLLGDAVRILDGGGASAAISLARSILSEGKPVALVLDTDTLDPRKIRKRLAFLEEALGQIAIRDRWKVVLLKPTLEGIFFQDTALLHRLIGREPSKEHLERSRTEPKRVLMELLGAQEETFSQELCRRLDSVDLHPLTRMPPLQELIHFFSPSEARPPPF